MNIGEKIKVRREELGLTMKALADKIGVSEGTVSRWESGEIANMRRDKIYNLSKALNMPVSEIMGWSELPDDPRFRRLYAYYLGLSDHQKDQLEDYIEYLKSKNNKEE